jgi:hypothetical protein
MTRQLSESDIVKLRDAILNADSLSKALDNTERVLHELGYSRITEPAPVLGDETIAEAKTRAKFSD